MAKPIILKLMFNPLLHDFFCILGIEVAQSCPEEQDSVGKCVPQE